MATIDKPLPNVDNDKAQEEIVEIINSNTYSGLSAKTKLQEYKKI